MANTLKILDLCCGAGGCSMGIYQAAQDHGIEIEIHGVDIVDRPEYPFTFHCADALTFPLEGFDAYHASPPCQSFSWSANRWANQGKEYNDILSPMRDRLLATGKPFTLENVIGAPLRKDIVLCGAMFVLKVYRHRIFEVHGFCALNPPHLDHPEKISTEGEFVTVAGHGGDGRSAIDVWRAAMGIDWMSRQTITQAIPPAYTRYLWGFFMQSIDQSLAA